MALPHEADIIIVGAGTAGCVLAARLSERAGRSVLLLEAGEEAQDPRVLDPAAWPLLAGSALDYAYVSEPQRFTADRAHPWPRGRGVGGSTLIHAMGHMRGHPTDFDAWAAGGARGWDHDALLPSFKRSETSPFAREDPQHYGADGPIHLSQPAAPHPLTLAHIEACRSLGIAPIRDHNGPQMAGATLNTLTIANGRRQTIAAAYLTDRVRARPNLQIATGCLVDRVSFEDGGRAAQGVEVMRGGPRHSVRARAVILAAGAIASPMILMRSGIGPSAHLADLGIAVRQDASGVGDNLQDHLLSGGNVYRSRRPVPPTTTQHSESLTYLHAAGQDRREAPELVVGIITVPLVSEALLPRLDEAPPGPGEGYTLTFGITHPRSRGTLRLAARDPQAPPVIDPAYLSAEIDRQHFAQALALARRIGSSEAYAPWRLAEILPRPADLEDEASIERFIARAAITHHHPVGTCRMGEDAAAPVASDLRVKGIENLHVVDASVFPSLTTGPVNAAIVAVAERAADILAI